MSCPRGVGSLIALLRLQSRLEAQGPEILDLEGVKPVSRDDRRGSAVTHRGVGDGIGQVWPGNTTSGAHQGSRRMTPKSLFGAQGVWGRGGFLRKEVPVPVRVSSHALE
jgi:hypothetical protein